MKVNTLLMDMIRGQWLMSFEGLSVYAPFAHKLLSGEDVDLNSVTKSLMNVMDDNGKLILPDKNGVLEIPQGSVAIIDMIGPVIKYSDWCTYGADEIIRALRMADNNPNIIGSIFNVDSPGGGVSAIGPFVEFGKTKKKPVQGLLDQACSLGYWAALAVCDQDGLMVDNDISASVGSVGVVSTFVDNKAYLEGLGYKFHEIYADESQHKNEAFRLAREGKYDLIKKEHLSPLAQKFQQAVRDARPSLKEELGVLTGKVFGAQHALEYGMIDNIGSLDQAVNLLHIKSELKTL
jgi:protease-4